MISSMFRLAVALTVLFIFSCAKTPSPPTIGAGLGIDSRQVPNWTEEDLSFFINGSMGTEVIPMPFLLAFQSVYPDLFPSIEDVGLIPLSDRPPIGTSIRAVPHLGNMEAVGVNCASCHVGEVVLEPGERPLRVLGMTSHFDAVGFFGAVTVAMLRTTEPSNMKSFLSAYISGDTTFFESEWARQERAIIAMMKADPFASKNMKGKLHEISPDELRFDTEHADLPRLARAVLRVFHNMRTALHIPEKLPDNLPPPPGPGRNDAFGLLSLSFFGVPITPAYVKFGLVWNLEDRQWVHWDGNNDDPLARNLAAALGLGAPYLGGKSEIDLAAVQRHTDLSEKIIAPLFPFPADAAAAERGASTYQKQCASCHDVTDEAKRLFDPKEIGTDPSRAAQIDDRQEAMYLELFSKMQIAGFTHSGRPPFKKTGRYWASDLAGVWARSPYLHNGSVRTMRDLLMPAADRPKTFRRGAKLYDRENMGYVDAGDFVFDVAAPTNSNAGHEYGTTLTDDEKRDLISYLYTR